MQQGSYSIPLLATTPPSVFAACVELGTVYITPQRVDPNLFADADMQAMARYAGPLLKTQRNLNGYTLDGAHMTWFLGGEDGSGPSDLETAITFSAATPTTVVAAAGLLPVAIGAGTITTAGVSAYNGHHEFESPLDALRTYCKTVNGHFKVQPDATIDFSLTTATSGNPYNGGGVTPTTVVVREGFGSDPELTGVPVRSAETKRDARPYRTRVALIQEREDAAGYMSLVSGSTRGTIPYKDVNGNTLDRTIWLERPASADVDLDQLLATELGERVVEDVQEIDTDQYEIVSSTTGGSGFDVGDWFYIYDPPTGFDTSQDTVPTEIVFRGQTIWPKKTRLLRASWPVADGMGIYYRDADGVFTDLSRWVRWEA